MTECPAHPGVEAIGTCTRCGRFYCAAEVKVVDGQPYCAACAERPEIDWLTRHYAALEGRRSGLAWFTAFLGLLGLVGGGAVLVALVDLVRDSLGGFATQEDLRWLLTPLGLIVWSVSALAVVSGRRWALTGNLVASVLTAALLAATNPTPGGQLFVGGVTLVLTVLFSVVLRRDVRTRLFFRLPVSREALRQHYERYGSNWQASSAARLAALGLFIPGLGVISLALGIWGLSRVDRGAVPPVGGLGSAAGAILVSALSCALWGMLVFR